MNYQNFDDFEDDEYDPDSDDFDVDDEDADDQTVMDRLKRRRAQTFRYRPGEPFITPGQPPQPPLPPKPPKVIGIRGLDIEKYKLVQEKAKEQGRTISDLLDEIINRYLTEEEGYIGPVDALDITQEDLKHLEDEVRFIEIERLTFASDITREDFKKVKEIRNVRQVMVPSHLYLLASRVARDCSIEKYSGEDTLTIVEKTFNGDVDLPREFFQVFLANNQKIKLRVYGDLTLKQDIPLEEFRMVVHSLTVDGDASVPKHLIGLVYAIGNVDGEIYVEKE